MTNAPIPAKPFSTIPLAERWITIIALFFSTGAVLTLLNSLGRNDRLAGDTDPVQKLVWAIIYATVVFFLSKNITPYLAAARRNLVFIALTALTLASPLWSIEPSYSIARSIAMFGTMLFGLYLGTRYTRAELLHLIAVALFWLGLLSILTALLLPAYGVDSTVHIGAWRGVLNHKNNLGRLCALGVLVYFICIKDIGLMPYRKMFYQLGIVFMAICTVMTTSKTSLLLMILGIGLYVVFRMIGARNTALNILAAAVMAVMIAILSTGLFSYIVENTLTAMGCDMTMTGRTEIWETLFVALRDHWWLGFGPGAFWISGRGALGMIWPNGGWIPPHAHNGIMELWVALGFIGVVLFTIAYYGALRLGYKALKPKPAVDIFPLAYFVLMLVADITEISIMRHNNTYWVLFVALVVRLKIESAEQPAPHSRTTSLALAIRKNIARQKS